jgi:hypothetical protein
MTPPSVKRQDRDYKAEVWLPTRVLENVSPCPYPPSHFKDAGGSFPWLKTVKGVNPPPPPRNLHGAALGTLRNDNSKK